MDTLGAVSAVFRAAPALSVYNGAQIKVISAEMGAYFIGSLAQLKRGSSASKTASSRERSSPSSTRLLAEFRKELPQGDEMLLVFLFSANS